MDTDIPKAIRHAAEHVPGVRQIEAVRARWLGHRLTADIDIALDGTATLQEADGVSAAVREALLSHISALATVRVLVKSFGTNLEAAPAGTGHQTHHHAPAPFVVQSKLAEGVLEIIETPSGECMQLKTTRAAVGLSVEVCIQRDAGRIERLVLTQVPNDPTRFMSSQAPEEPHEFDATLMLCDDNSETTLAFHLTEPEGHH